MRCNYLTLENMVKRKICYGIVQPGQSVTDGIPVIKVNNLISGLKSLSELDTTTRENEAKYIRTRLHGGELIISVVGTIGKTAIVPKSFAGCNLVRATALIDIEDALLSKWVKYYIDSPYGQSYIEQNLNTTVQPTLNIRSLEKMSIPLYDAEYMKKIVILLSSLDEKIAINREINDNLEQQAFALFDSLFPRTIDGSQTIGDYINPKRGRNLLSKDAVYGTVPVVAGGLEPSTYHNVANTKAPVLTISASGANAGFVNLWLNPVWSSDSSYIDSSMTPNVFFWYILLKGRQKEIFDAQTGSAQPHIYPQHIAAMPIGNLNQESVSQFTTQVAPLFELIGANKDENERLRNIRDALLPRLMSGEIDVTDICI